MRTDALSPTALSEVPISPAPWDLVGRGAILFTCPPKGSAHRLRTPGAFTFVDYEQSGVDPYLELLYVPRFTHSGGIFGPTIDRIWVTSPRSVVSGRANWGIPKDLAAITRDDGSDGTERWEARLPGGETLGALTLRPYGPPLPVAKPRALGRLLQRMDGRRYATPISVRGRVRLARVEELTFGAVFADLDASQVKLAVVVERFAMGFHEARIN
ncbi:MAG: acetoacetate decarboxylase family protein [Solirubrobacteraceae bacterium]|nr:acetoacetate decarboxylase family protein [Solirubrobacteraceae bacterium]